ncbi:putative unknown [Vibrio phage 242E40-1]|nr:putative unknown [Vibrio phage 242E40-1]
MNREIRFRAWCNDQKRMFTKVLLGNTSNPDSDDYTAHCIYRDNDWYHSDEHDSVEWLQFTNQTDINNKDIFDQDIVKLTFENAAWDEPVVYHEVVRFHKGMWMAGDKPLYRDEYAPYTVEVIGNIFESAELISDELASSGRFKLVDGE